jgi:hypothetical protein
MFFIFFGMWLILGIPEGLLASISPHRVKVGLPVGSLGAMVPAAAIPVLKGVAVL